MTIHTTARALAAALATACTIAAATAGTPTAAAAGDRAIGAGQPLRYVSAAGSSTCTLGFTFIAQGHTLGVTAGHCVAEHRGYMIDADTGDRGRVAAYDYDPSREGNDYALIDFGQARASGTLLDTPIAAAEPPPDNATICHTGVASGTSCATLAGRYGTQYLTTEIADIPGDSGGPVWTRYGTADIAIVGIWLGSHRTADRTYGRFFPIAQALTGLGLTTAADRAGAR